ncbi:MAG: hypothetical protein KDC57_07135 [Saprospiraceae bacterium]|nr:hypothetical protein [Saprospiraceae bacterium]
MKSGVGILLLFFAVAMDLPAQDSYLYKCTTVQAAPGQLMALIDHLKTDLDKVRQSGEEPAYMFRHQQGDRWDLMILAPIGNYSDYFTSQAAQILEHPYGSDYYNYVALQEEGFVRGPNLDLFRQTWQNNTYFHAEMFVALPGKHEELYREREMENAYSQARGGIYNMIFTKENGFVWDIFTLGGYRDFKHYAETQMSTADKETAARQAGFESAAAIGPYLRSLINYHHDTLGAKID